MDKLEDYMKPCTTYCTVDCMWNNGKGKYRVCHNPSNTDRLSPGGVDRYYTNGCGVREEKKDD